MAGLGPESWPTPTCQRLTVLKNFAWSTMSPRKMWGGGSSFGSAQPNAQHASQIPANSPTDRHDHSTTGAARSAVARYRAERCHNRASAGLIGLAGAVTSAIAIGSGSSALPHHAADLYFSWSYSSLFSAIACSRRVQSM